MLRLLLAVSSFAVASCITNTPFSSKGFFVAAPFVGNQGWDPLNLGSADTLDTLVSMRHAELKHGRLAMLAAVGIPASEFGHPYLVQAAGLVATPKSVLAEGGFSPSFFNGGLSQPEVAPALAFALCVGSAFESECSRLLTRAPCFSSPCTFESRPYSLRDTHAREEGPRLQRVRD